MISKRLKAIASLVDDNSNIIDIGCDHALLDIYLTKYKNCHCIATDISENALNNARINIKKYNLENSIQTIVSDGFENINIENNSTIIIAGMGAKNILKILNHLDDNKVENLILSSHNEYEFLRNELSKKYHMIDEVVMEDKNIFYLILKIEKGGTKYNKKNRYLGPILKTKKDQETKKYYHYLYDNNLKIIQKLSNKHLFKKIDLKKKNHWIKKLNRK